MKILNVSVDDWANFAYSNSMALQSVGIDCKSFCLNEHPFKYPKHSQVVSVERMIEEVKKADVVQFFHDNISLFNLILPYCKGKKLIAYHTTSLYRKEYDRLNAQMNPHIYRAVNCMPEFMGKGAKNEVYMVGAVDTEYLSKFKNERSTPIIISHYPSNPGVKGTNRIVELMKQVRGDFEFVYSLKPIPYEQQLKRLSDCDIYIEMFTEKDGLGSDYGNFGITALEAAAMGKNVITMLNDYHIYGKTYKVFPFRFFHNYKSFEDCIEKNIENCRDSSKWVEFNHGYKASGEYILKNIL